MDISEQKNPSCNFRIEDGAYEKGWEERRSKDGKQEADQHCIPSDPVSTSIERR